MADGTPSPIPSDRHRSEASPRGERSPGSREGGFRIRLSDNEMRSARALQDAFGLRSTVAVLGFALRTLAQQLEEGKLDELVSQHRAQAPVRSEGREGRRERPEGRGGGGGGGGRWPEGRGAGGGRGGARVDPFARPARPTAAAESVASEPEASEPDEGETHAQETEPLTTGLETVGSLPAESEAVGGEPQGSEPIAVTPGDEQPAEATEG